METLKDICKKDGRYKEVVKECYLVKNAVSLLGGRRKERRREGRRRKKKRRRERRNGDGGLYGDESEREDITNRVIE